MALAWVAWGLYESYVIGRAPGDTPYHSGNTLFEDGYYERALTEYENALEQDPAHINALRGKARSLMQIGRYSEALAVFSDAIAMEPEFGGTYANRGILHDRMGNYELAVEDYQTALQLDPEVADGPHWLIRFLRNQPEKPPGIAERAAYILAELKKPASERILSIPEIDEQQRSYKK